MYSQVGRQLKEVDPHVDFHLFGGVDLQVLVGVNGDQQGAYVRLTIHTDRGRILIIYYQGRAIVKLCSPHQVLFLVFTCTFVLRIIVLWIVLVDCSLF